MKKMIKTMEMKRFCKLFEAIMNLFGMEIENFLFHRKKLEEAKLAQKLRVKPHGVNAMALAIGQKVTVEDLVLKVCYILYNNFGCLNLSRTRFDLLILILCI